MVMTMGMPAMISAPWAAGTRCMPNEASSGKPMAVPKVASSVCPGRCRAKAKVSRLRTVSAMSPARLARAKATVRGPTSCRAKRVAGRVRAKAATARKARP